MNETIANVLIEASAGTGKTQALAERLIALVEAGVKPEEIVALTFSRAAAGEIFERFVSLLAERGKTTILRRVIAAQHLSQIGTLDSFLMRIVRAFPHELGLPAELELMDDSAALSARAKISFSILRRTEAKLAKAFTEAFSLAMNREDVRSFVDSYRAFIGAWHSRLTALPDPAAWGEPTTIWGRDPAFAHITERELAAAADAIDRQFAADEKWHAFAEWVRAFRGSFGSPTGYTGKILGLDDPFAGDQISFKFRKVVNLSRQETIVVRDALMAVFGYVVRMKLDLARGIHRLVSEFEAAYEKRVRAEGRLVFDDIPRLLTRLPDADRLALEYRLDARIRAWAIDEFQDTSREQWAALENLIDEAKQSDGEKSLFIVGDRKQAIYGWRNGDVSIFEREKNSGDYRTAPLIKTYRSGPVVVEAVNRVFARGRIFDEFPAWASPEHVSAKPELGGFVRVMDAPGTSMADFVEPVAQALKARPVNGSTAILVRKNAFGKLLADELKLRGIDGVVWEGESAILDTPVLAPFLDLVRLADHPGDKLTYRHFTLSALARAKYPEGVPEIGALSAEMAAAFTARGLVRTFRELRATLPEDPREAWSVFSEERFTDLLRAAAEFELGMKVGSRLADFPSYLEMKKKRTVAEDGKIKIMTIHRSKGLGFDFVILPLYEHESLRAEPKGPLIGGNWILPDPTSRVSRAVGGLEAAAALRKDRAEQEALCGYYVAMTRAKRGMTLILHPAAKSGGALHFSDLVRAADLGDLVHPEATAENPDAGKSPRPDAGPTLAPPAREPRTTVRRRLPSQLFQSGMSAGSLFAARNARQEAMARGTAAHKAMEMVEFDAEYPKPEGFVELWREKAFEVVADGEWISGRFDRVTFFRTPDGELNAEIIDFKSSLAHPERYAGQLATYRRALAALTGLPPERISTRLTLARKI